MCEAAAYLLKNGEERLILEQVGGLEPEGDEVKLRSIFEEKSFSLVNHKIVRVAA
jgi:predicted RNA-binding protein